MTESEKYEYILEALTSIDEKLDVLLINGEDLVPFWQYHSVKGFSQAVKIALVEVKNVINGLPLDDNHSLVLLVLMADEMVGRVDGDQEEIALEYCKVQGKVDSLINRVVCSVGFLDYLILV